MTTTARIKHLLSLAEAEERGEEVQFNAGSGDRPHWVVSGGISKPSNLQHALNFPENYRIAQKPKLRPWTLEEVPELPIQVRWKSSGHSSRTFIAAASDTCIWVGGATEGIGFAAALKELEQLDGTPCGVTEP